MSYCSNCGNYLGIGDNYCSSCGRAKSFSGLSNSYLPKIQLDNSDGGMKRCPACDGKGTMSDFEYGMWTILTVGILPLANGGNDCMTCKGTGRVKKDVTYYGSE